jgi:HEAT repeat protein
VPTRALPSSTEPDAELPSQHVAEKLAAILRAATEESFEDGMESALSRGLEGVVRRNGRQAVVELIPRIICESVNQEVASEALRSLGRMTHPESLPSRRWLLERALFSSSARVRDAAGLGLASLDDPHAIPYVRQAIDREPCEELRADLRLTLTQLESAARAVHPPQGA